jgi:hypothetical protein
MDDRAKELELLMRLIKKSGFDIGVSHNVPRGFVVVNPADLPKDAIIERS